MNETIRRHDRLLLWDEMNEVVKISMYRSASNDLAHIVMDVILLLIGQPPDLDSVCKRDCNKYYNAMYACDYNVDIFLLEHATEVSYTPNIEYLRHLFRVLRYFSSLCYCSEDVAENMVDFILHDGMLGEVYLYVTSRRFVLREKDVRNDMHFCDCHWLWNAPLLIDRREKILNLVINHKKGGDAGCCGEI